MNVVSISQLKSKPSEAIKKASEFPVAVEKRSKVQAYLLGKELYDKLIDFVEDYIDVSVVKKTDFKKGKDFEKVAKELGI